MLSSLEPGMKKEQQFKESCFSQVSRSVRNYKETENNAARGSNLQLRFPSPYAHKDFNIATILT